MVANAEGNDSVRRLKMEGIRKVRTRATEKPGDIAAEYALAFVFPCPKILLNNGILPCSEPQALVGLIDIPMAYALRPLCVA